MLAPSADIVPMRFASVGDEESLVSLLKLRHDEIEHDPLHEIFSEPRVRETIQRATQPRRNHPDAGESWCGVIGEPGNLQASVYLSVQKSWSSDNRALFELWNYIHPEHRRKVDARLIIAFSQGIAEAMGLRLYGAVMLLKNHPGYMRLYERQGCRVIGSFYVYDRAGLPAGVN